MVVWMIRGKIIRTVLCVLCTTVVHNDMHTRVPVVLTVDMLVLGLGLVFVCLFRFSILCVFVF